MLIVVRHAEAVYRVVGSPPEDGRPLTPLGEQQAVELVDQRTGDDRGRLRPLSCCEINRVGGAVTMRGPGLPAQSV